MEKPVIRQQSQADFAWTLCHTRDLPVKHNKLLHSVTQRKGASLKHFKMKRYDVLSNRQIKRHDCLNRTFFYARLTLSMSYGGTPT